MCGSGFQALLSAAAELREAEAWGGADAGAGAGTALIGGAESMSQAPLAVYGADVRFGHRMGVRARVRATAAAARAHARAHTGATSFYRPPAPPLARRRT